MNPCNRIRQVFEAAGFKVTQLQENKNQDAMYIAAPNDLVERCRYGACCFSIRAMQALDEACEVPQQLEPQAIAHTCADFPNLICPACTATKLGENT